MMHYPWPGNVRELGNAHPRFVAERQPRELLPRSTTIPAPRPGPELPHSLLHKRKSDGPVEPPAVALEPAPGAKVLGISYSALRRRIEKYGLKKHSAYHVKTQDDGDTLELRISAKI